MFDLKEEELVNRSTLQPEPRWEKERIKGRGDLTVFSGPHAGGDGDERSLHRHQHPLPPLHHRLPSTVWTPSPTGRAGVVYMALKRPLRRHLMSPRCQHVASSLAPASRFVSWSSSANVTATWRFLCLAFGWNGDAGWSKRVLVASWMPTLSSTVENAHGLNGLRDGWTRVVVSNLRSHGVCVIFIYVLRPLAQTLF